MKGGLSIITVVYNDASALEKTILSIRQQSFKNIQFIVVDGQSTDRTREVIEKNKALITDLISEPDNGIYDAMNKGIRRVSGKWVIFLNAGDVFADKDVLEKVYEQGEHANSKLITGPYVLVGTTGEWLLEPKSFNSWNLLIWGTRVVNHQSLFVRHDCLVEYDLRFQLKAELNWYFDLVERINGDEITVTRYPITKYQLGGIGEQRLFLNLREHFQVLFQRKGILGVLGLPVLVYKFFRTKFFHQ